MYAFTGHKWVLGPEGIGALYVRQGLPVYSPNVGFLSLTDPTDFDIEGGYELRSDARRFEASTMSPALAGGFAAAAEAARERSSAGFEEIRHRADLLTDLLSGLPRVTSVHQDQHNPGWSASRSMAWLPETPSSVCWSGLYLRYLPVRTPTSGRVHTCSIQRGMEVARRGR